MKMQYLESLQAFVTTEIRIWDPSQPPSGHTLQQSCNEESSKILGEGCWYGIHDFVATFRVNDRPIYMVLCS